MKIFFNRLVSNINSNILWEFVETPESPVGLSLISESTYPFGKTTEVEASVIVNNHEGNTFITLHDPLEGDQRVFGIYFAEEPHKVIYGMEIFGGKFTKGFETGHIGVYPVGSVIEHLGEQHLLSKRGWLSLPTGARIITDL